MRIFLILGLISLPILVLLYNRLRIDKAQVVMFLLAIPTAFGSVLAYLIYVPMFFLKTRAMLYNNIRSNISEENVNLLMNDLKKHGIINEPKYYNELRSIWFLINESDKITTAQKTEFRETATAEGLRINMQERAIIDNYAKS